MASPPIKDPMLVRQEAALAYTNLINSETSSAALVAKIVYQDDGDLLLAVVELLFDSKLAAFSALINADFDFNSIITGLYRWERLIFGAILRKEKILKTMSDKHFEEHQGHAESWFCL